MANRKEKGTTQPRGNRTATRCFSHFVFRPHSLRRIDDSISRHDNACIESGAGGFVFSPATSCRGVIARHGMASVAALDDRHMPSWQAGRRGGSVGAQASGRHACTGLYLYLAI